MLSKQAFLISPMIVDVNYSSSVTDYLNLNTLYYCLPLIGDRISGLLGKLALWFCFVCMNQYSCGRSGGQEKLKIIRTTEEGETAPNNFVQ
jgi:hypothetical protein